MDRFDFPLAEFLPEPVLVLDAKTHCVQWMNPAAQDWTRRSLDHLLGKKITEISPDFEDLSESLERDLHFEGSIHGHDLSVRLWGNRKYLCSYIVYGLPRGIAVLLRPEQYGRGGFVGAQRQDAVTMLGRMLAHELKNPLAGIRGAAQLLEAELSEPDDLELTALITTEVDRIGRLADQMEKFGAVEKGTLVPFNVHTILRKASLLFQSQSHENIQIKECYDPSLPPVLGDQDALMQVVVNLISNAIEAIKSAPSNEHDGEQPIREANFGQIEIMTLYRTGIRRRLKDGTTMSLPMEIRIIDNGPGIDADLKARIFQPFVTSKANGHGLGLALVSKIIAEHDGLIDLKSEPGKTVFSILLPIGLD